MNAFDIQKPESFSDYSLQTKILGINGSPRKNGNSEILLESIIKGVKTSGIDIDKIYLKDHQYISCIGCECCRKDKICTGLKDGMSLIYPGILESKGLILISPTHNYNITAWMKSFIDRLYCFYNFNKNDRSDWSSQLGGQGRKAIISAVCEQENKDDMGFTMEAMRRPLEALGYEISGELPVCGVFSRGEVKEKTEVLEMAFKLGKEMAESLME